MTSSRRRATGCGQAAAAGAAVLLLAGCGGGSASAAGPARTPPASPVTSAAPSAAAPGMPATPAPSSAVPAPAASSTTSSSAPPATSSTVPRAASPTATPACRTAQLTVALGGPSEGAAGTSSTYLLLTNTGPSACSLDGHPGVSYVAGTDGHQVGRSAERFGTPALVLLAPRAVGSAELRTVSYQAYDPALCAAVPVTGYRVYPPDQTAAAYVRQAGSTCSGDVRVLSVGPVRAGVPTA